MGKTRSSTLPFLLGVFLHHGELLVGLVQHTVGDLVGLVDVGRNVAVRLLRIGDDRRYEVLVASIGDTEGLLAVGVLLDGVDGVGDNRV